MNSPCVHGLPLQDLLPGLLVVLVVDFNDVGHVVGSELIVSPAPPAADGMRLFRRKEEMSGLQQVLLSGMSLKFFLYLDPPLPQHGVPEHLLRRVHPVLLRVVARDGGLLSVGGQVKGLVRRRLLVWRRHLHGEGSGENSTSNSQPETPASGSLIRNYITILIHKLFFFKKLDQSFGNPNPNPSHVARTCVKLQPLLCDIVYISNHKCNEWLRPTHSTGLTHHVCWINVTVCRCRCFHWTSNKLVGPVLVGGTRLCLVPGEL